MPEIESTGEVADWCVRAFGQLPERIAPRAPLHHGFTHFDLEMTPVEVHVQPPERVLEGGRWLWYNVRRPARVGLAAPVSRLLRELSAADSADHEGAT